MAVLQRSACPPDLSVGSVPAGEIEGIDQLIGIEGLLKERDRAPADRMCSCSLIQRPCHHDDRNSEFPVRQNRQQIETDPVRHVEVEQQTVGPFGPGTVLLQILQKLIGRWVQPDGKTFRFEKRRQRIPHSIIVVNNTD